ncbi:MAG: molybdopterin/thiamine biosynthesis adenylyltransferase [Oleispira sp.]|jgi:molybdopterin/thiamine biosynthesis adenylyltransferase
MNSLNIKKEDFYTEFTLRNAGFISEQEQAVLRNSVILVAGCGSTGGSAIELLVRSGAENLILIDNGTYDLNNSNRQNMTLDDIGALKPEVFRLRCNAINPFAIIEVCNIGITPDNVEDYVNRADIVIDAVDVTGRSGLEMKFLLHQVCHEYHKAVICGYDMAATQYIPIFDYRDKKLPLFDNQITTEMVATMEPLKVCTFLVPVTEIPEAMFEELERSQQGKDYTSQLGIAANLFGTITTGLVIDMLNNKTVKKDYTVDVWKLIRGEYENTEKLAIYQGAIEKWKKEDDDIQDNEFLKRSIKYYELPFIPSLLSNFSNKKHTLSETSTLLALGIPHKEIDSTAAKQLLRYAFVHYAKVGFINQKQASKELLHSEPLDSLSADDIHIVVLEKLTGKVMAYSTLKAPIDLGVKFPDENRTRYSVEKAFGQNLYSGIDALSKYKVEQVREIGRVVKSHESNPVVSGKVGVMLLAAYRALIADPKNNIYAMVGDGETNVTLRNLELYGFNPILIDNAEVCIPKDNLYSSRYSGRSVSPFWFEVCNINLKKSFVLESLLTLRDKQFLKTYKKLKNDSKNTKNTPPLLVAETES